MTGCQELGMGMTSLDGCDYYGVAQVGSLVALEPEWFWVHEALYMGASYKGCTCKWVHAKPVSLPKAYRLYQRQFPGFNIGYSYARRKPLGEAGWRVLQTSLNYFCNFKESHLFQNKKVTKIAHIGTIPQGFAFAVSSTRNIFFPICKCLIPWLPWDFGSIGSPSWRSFQSTIYKRATLVIFSLFPLPCFSFLVNPIILRTTHLFVYFIVFLSSPLIIWLAYMEELCLFFMLSLSLKQYLPHSWHPINIWWTNQSVTRWSYQKEESCRMA